MSRKFGRGYGPPRRPSGLVKRIVKVDIQKFGRRYHAWVRVGNTVLRGWTTLAKLSDWAKRCGVERVEHLVAKFIKERTEGVRQGNEAPADEAFEKMFPATWEYCTLSVVKNKPRVTSSMTIFTEQGKWKMAFKERQTGWTLWVSADTFQGLLEALETHLAAGTGDWREDKWKKK